MALSIQKLIEKYQKNQDFYWGKEIGDGTQWFSKDILESDIFTLIPGNTKVSNTYRYEATRGDDGDRGDDFILNIDGIIVPVEVEMYENLRKWEWQIEKYMKRKNSLYGILTDGWTWRFYTRGYHGW
jgi:signal peptidase I